MYSQIISVQVVETAFSSVVFPWEILIDGYLYSSLWQISAHCQSLPHHHIWVVSLLESFLQGFQLLSCESCAASPLFAVLGAITGLQDDVLKRTAVGR